jgi:cell fate (sporulation/competence/biofilm development) regulator YlbF (YheA/YmcA/DUF963 family)
MEFTMDVIEMAKELAQAITQDERCMHLQLSKATSDGDMELQKLIGEFNLIKIRLSVEYKKTPPDNKKLEKIQSELKHIYANIMRNPNMTEYTAAKEEMDKLLMHINSIIQMSISGEIDTDACGGNCEGCGGGCSH